MSENGGGFLSWIVGVLRGWWDATQRVGDVWNAEAIRKEASVESQEALVESPALHGSDESEARDREQDCRRAIARFRSELDRLQRARESAATNQRAALSNVDERPQDRDERHFCRIVLIPGPQSRNGHLQVDPDILGLLARCAGPGIRVRQGQPVLWLSHMRLQAAVEVGKKVTLQLTKIGYDVDFRVQEYPEGDQDPGAGRLAPLNPKPPVDSESARVAIPREAAEVSVDGNFVLA